MTHPKEGQIIAGKYRLDRPLSKGGMGAVWSATHTDLGMKVAVKLMEPHMAAHPEWRQRFAREAKAAGAIQSPHVVKVHDYGVDGDTPYLVMELLQGEDLGVRLRREHRLSLESTARIVLAIAKGLKRAHEAGVIHRDLKPANIFLTRADDDEIVQILDFGIARLTHGDPAEDRTETGVVLGSIRYMSPEQARGFKTADHRSDLWSLAVIAYRSLTGELPYDGVEAGDILVKLCTDPLPSAAEKLPTLAPALRRSLDQFFARALSRSPEERFQTARELADALCVLAGLEVEAPTTTSTPMASLPVGNNLVTNADTPIQDPTTTGTMPVPPRPPRLRVRQLPTSPSPRPPTSPPPSTAPLKDDSPAPATSQAHPQARRRRRRGHSRRRCAGSRLVRDEAADPPLPGSNVSAAETQ
ncbi:MAG: serine/threonine-protein kinase [Polyangiaceae bacterium]